MLNKNAEILMFYWTVQVDKIVIYFPEQYKLVIWQLADNSKLSCGQRFLFFVKTKYKMGFSKTWNSFNLKKEVLFSFIPKRVPKSAQRNLTRFYLRRIATDLKINTCSSPFPAVTNTQIYSKFSVHILLLWLSKTD